MADKKKAEGKTPTGKEKITPGSRPPRKRKPKRKGPPRTKLPLDTVEKLAGIGCTDQEIAYVCGVSPKTVQRRRKDDPAFLSAIEKGAAVGRMSLRSAQFKAAIGGNATMMIWLGKQLLGQTDKTDLLSAGRPIRKVTIQINGTSKDGEEDHGPG